MQSQTPLSIGRRDDAMIKSCPFSHDALFEVDHIVNLGAVLDTFLQYIPDTVANRIEVQGVRRPQNVGRIKSGVSVVNSATVSLAR